MIPNLEDLKVKIFADGADLGSMKLMYKEPHIKGLTTNPTLMRKAGIENYQEFALEVLSQMTEKPISLEVFCDDLDEMIIQGTKISSWGENVFVKIPITNTLGISTVPVIESLCNSGIKVNVTAVMTSEQVSAVSEVLNSEIPSYVSVFAGRIADTGRDPLPIIERSIFLLSGLDKAEVIWASPRELLNIFQADQVGCHVITATNDILNKIPLIGRDLEEYSLDTVKMFYKDALGSGYSI